MLASQPVSHSGQSGQSLTERFAMSKPRNLPNKEFCAVRIRQANGVEAQKFKIVGSGRIDSAI